MATEAQHRIGEALAGMTSAQIEGTGFDQLGIRDGLEVVEEYLRAGELGLAFDHLLYMVVETEIALASTSVRFLEETATAFGLPPPRVPSLSDLPAAVGITS